MSLHILVEKAMKCLSFLKTGRLPSTAEVIKLMVNCYKGPPRSSRLTSGKARSNTQVFSLPFGSLGNGWALTDLEGKENKASEKSVITSPRAQEFGLFKMKY